MLLLRKGFVHRANAAGLDSCHPIIPQVGKAKATWLGHAAEPTAD
jgi:hypothetical protein